MKEDKFILDMCCGPRMFWFNKKHPNTIYQDIREEEKGFVKLRPSCEVKPDVLADFREMPYSDKSFKLIIFDPPHLTRGGENSWMIQKYGKLNKDTWKEDLKKGFDEAWRVLDDFGVLIFKWNEYSIPIKDIVPLMPVQPLFGHTTARSGKTKWVTLMKIPGQKK